MAKKTRRKAHIRGGVRVRSHVITIPDSVAVPPRWQKPPPAAVLDAAADAAVQQPVHKMNKSDAAEFTNEDLDQAVLDICDLPLAVQSGFTESNWRDVQRAGHQAEGCGCGVTRSDLEDEIAPESVERIYACIEGKYDEFNIAAVRLRSWLNQIQAAKSLRERLTSHDHDSRCPDDALCNADRFAVYLAAQEPNGWTAPDQQQHALYGPPFSLARIECAVRAVAKSWEVEPVATVSHPTEDAA